MKLLGLYIDSGYNFSTHIKNMKSSVLFKISCIKKISSYLSDANVRTMVESLVLSKISYCGEIYIRKTMEVQKQVQRRELVELHLPQGEAAGSQPQKMPAGTKSP